MNTQAFHHVPGKDAVALAKSIYGIWREASDEIWDCLTFGQREKWIRFVINAPSLVAEATTSPRCTHRHVYTRVSVECNDCHEELSR